MVAAVSHGWAVVVVELLAVVVVATQQQGWLAAPALPQLLELLPAARAKAKTAPRCRQAPSRLHAAVQHESARCPCAVEKTRAAQRRYSTTTRRRSKSGAQVPQERSGTHAFFLVAFAALLSQCLGR